MPIILECPCGKRYRVKDELLGKKIKCPSCQRLLVVSSLQGTSHPSSMSVAPPKPPLTSSETGGPFNELRQFTIELAKVVTAPGKFVELERRMPIHGPDGAVLGVSWERINNKAAQQHKLKMLLKHPIRWLAGVAIIFATIGLPLTSLLAVSPETLTGAVALFLSCVISIVLALQIVPRLMHVYFMPVVTTISIRSQAGTIARIHRTFDRNVVTDADGTCLAIIKKKLGVLQRAIVLNPDGTRFAYILGRYRTNAGTNWKALSGDTRFLMFASFAIVVAVLVILLSILIAYSIVTGRNIPRTVRVTWWFFLVCLAKALHWHHVRNKSHQSVMIERQYLYAKSSCPIGHFQSAMTAFEGSERKKASLQYEPNLESQIPVDQRVVLALGIVLATKQFTIR